MTKIEGANYAGFRSDSHIYIKQNVLTINRSLRWYNKLYAPIAMLKPTRQAEQ